jgi:hypothetical protein
MDNVSDDEANLKSPNHDNDNSADTAEEGEDSDDYVHVRSGGLGEEQPIGKSIELDKLTSH